MLQQRVYGGADKFGNVVSDLKLNAGRQLSANVVKARAHVIRDLHGVGAGLAQNLHGNDVLSGQSPAEETRPSAQLLRAVFHLRNIANADQGATADADDNVAELLGGRDAAQRSQA